MLACNPHDMSGYEDQAVSMPLDQDDDQNLDRSIGERVKSARMHRQMTMAALAAELGMTYQQIHKYETGRNRISASTLFKVASTLGVELSYFFADCGPKPFKAVSPAKSPADAELRSALLRVEDDEVRQRLAQLVDAIQDMEQSKPKP